MYMTMSEYLRCSAKKKFVVVKIDDMKYLHDYERDELAAILLDIDYGRKKEGKKTDNEYLVINTDEPYTNEIIDILKKHRDWG